MRPRWSVRRGCGRSCQGRCACMLGLRSLCAGALVYDGKPPCSKPVDVSSGRLASPHSQQQMSAGAKRMVTWHRGYRSGAMPLRVQRKTWTLRSAGGSGGVSACQQDAEIPGRHPPADGKAGSGLPQLSTPAERQAAVVRKIPETAVSECCSNQRWAPAVSACCNLAYVALFSSN